MGGSRGLEEVFVNLLPVLCPQHRPTSVFLESQPQALGPDWSRMIMPPTRDWASCDHVTQSGQWQASF